MGTDKNVRRAAMPFAGGTRRAATSSDPGGAGATNVGDFRHAKFLSPGTPFGVGLPQRDQPHPDFQYTTYACSRLVARTESRMEPVMMQTTTPSESGVGM